MVKNVTRYSNENLKKLFAAQGLRQDWFADQMEIDQSYVSKLLSADKPLTEALATRAARILRVPVSFLLADEPVAVSAEASDAA